MQSNKQVSSVTVPTIPPIPTVTLPQITIPMINIPFIGFANPCANFECPQNSQCDVRNGQPVCVRVDVVQGENPGVVPAAAPAIQPAVTAPTPFTVPVIGMTLPIIG
jgi:hypothetical protein